MKIKAFPFIVEAASRCGKSGARLVYKTEDGATARAFAPFDAYFYLLPEGDAEAAAKRAAKLKATVRKGEATVTRVERVKLKLGFEEKAFLKIFASAPEHVPRLRDEAKALGETFEYRIPFTKRFAIDTGLVPNEAHEFEVDSGEISSIKRVDRAKMPELRVMSFDIETYNPVGMPRSDKDAILMISYATFKEGKPVGKVLSWKESKHEFVEAFKDEKSMIAEFIERVRLEKIDVLTGYNSDEFDLPYFVERCKKLKIAFNVGRDKHPISFKQIGLRKRARVSGRVHFDAFNAIALLNKVGANKFSRLSLEVVYSELLDKKKPSVKKLEIWRAWDNGGKALEELFEYSRSDAIACLEIADYVLPMEIELSRITGLPLFEVSRASASEMVESLLMRRAFERKEIVPKKPDYAVVEQRLRQPIEGAFVKVPEPGVYDDIAVFDFRSLYPSIIVSHNIDPATIGSKEKDAFESPTGARFSKRRGIVPETLERVLDERIEAKKLMANAKPADKPALNGRQIALKILANSFYGYLAYARSRYYSRECGESTTAWARKYIHETIEHAEKAGFKVLYGDSITDERCIAYLDCNGILRLAPIAEIFDRYGKTKTACGDKEVIYAPGIRALSVDPKTMEPIWRPVTEIIRHRNTKRVYRVRQKTGETRVTEDHSIMIDKRGFLEECKPADIGKKRLAYLRKIPAVKEITEINLTDWLGEYENKVRYKGRIKTRAIKVADDGSLTFSWTAQKRQIKVQRRYPVESPRFEALCRLLGAYIAEGSASTPETTGTRMGASIASGNREWLESLKMDYESLFTNARACVIRSNIKTRHLDYVNLDGMAHSTVYDDATCKLQMMNAVSAMVFKQLCGQKSYGKHLPEFIYHVPRKYKLLMLEKMVEGDGSRACGPRYTREYRDRNFKYHTSSLRLASGLSLLLNQLGINHSIRYYSKRKSYCVTTCSITNDRLGTDVVEEPYQGFVYDLSVEGSRMFTDACGSVVLHNTDSIFLRLGDKTKNDALAFQAGVNASLPGRMELELEDFYPRGIFVSKKQGEKGAKKKYALANDKGEIKIRGFELVRRDWSPIARDTQREALEILLKSGNVGKVKELVARRIDELKSGRMPLAQLAVRTQLRKKAGNYDIVSPEVSAVKKARAAGVDVAEHSLIEYVITKQGKSISEKASLIELVKEGDYDADYYVNNQLLPAVLKLLGALGTDADDLKAKGKQKGLMDF